METIVVKKVNVARYSLAMHNPHIESALLGMLDKKEEEKA